MEKKSGRQKLIKKSTAILLLFLAGCASPSAFMGTPTPSVKFESMLARHDPAAWRKSVETMNLRSNDFMVQLKNVNRRFNYVNYRSETGDKWLAPAEFIARGGDCEDYAIAKYLTLKAFGVADDDMRIGVFPDPLRVAGHAVLIVRHGGREWVLDYLRGSRIHQLGKGTVKTVNADGWRYL